MNKFHEFYAALLNNEKAKNQVEKILGDRAIEQVGDDELAKIGEIAQQLGYEITLEEARAYLNAEEQELDEDDLDAVAGGKVGDVRVHIIQCEIGGSCEPD